MHRSSSRAAGEPATTTVTHVTVEKPEKAEKPEKPEKPADAPVEVYAASAAEGALKDSSKTPSAGSHMNLDDLAEPPNSSSRPGPSESSWPSTSSMTPAPSERESSASVPQSPESAAVVSDTKQPPTEGAVDGKAQTKEEMIAEALECPCIASMKEGSCGDPFMSAYKCFLESETEPKGMDCMDQFQAIQSCIGEHPEEYNLDDDDDHDGDDAMFPTPADAPKVSDDPSSSKVGPPQTAAAST